MKEIVIDVETSAKGPKNSPSWWYQENKLLLYGVLEEGKYRNLAPEFIPREETLLIGHHLAFDLGWLIGGCALIDRQWLTSPKVVLWDTMVAEYLLTGQNPLRESLSLKNLCVKYGIASRSWAMAEIGDLESIPHADLIKYNKQDVQYTYELYKHQLSRVKNSKQLDFIIAQMQGRRTTILAEIQGLPFNKVTAKEELEELRTKQTALAGMLQDEMPHYLSLKSTKDLSCYLFGGTVKIKVEENVYNPDGTVVRYKSGLRKGEIKTKRVEIDMAVEPMIKARSDHPKTSHGVHSLDQKYLSLYDSTFIKALLELKELEKDISTYYEPFIKYADDSIDGRIHPQFNHAVTATGRLSSSRPNLQNVTNKE